MPIIRRRLQASSVYPDDLRYNEATDTVQSFINGSWVDNPQADPRTQTTFPPRITFNPACDAAQSVVDALKTQIDDILLAIDGAATAFTIAGIILSLFTFGVFGIFISLALGIGNTMLDAGTTALEAALTPAVYHTLVCILRCEMNTSGRLNPGSLPTVLAEVTSQIGGLGATILNAMLSLAGEGGINNLASLGTSTGDCADCGCPGLCPAEWVPYPAPGGGGTLVSQDGDIYVFDSEGTGSPGNYYLTIWTEEQFVGCCVSIGLTSGGPINDGAYTETGDPDVALVPGIPAVTTSVWILQLRGDTPFQVSLSFGDCA